MNFDLTDDQLAIQNAVAELASNWTDDYWADQDERHEFPWDFYNAFADAGWLGIAIPEEFGGSGLGILEASLMLEQVAASGAGMNGASRSTRISTAEATNAAAHCERGTACLLRRDGARRWTRHNTD
jgi:alkylation response protein AidB-like acyl-CoA dehydrogenase